MSIKVIQYGLGPIGLETAKAAARRPSIRLVGAIDVDPGKAGRDLGQLTGVQSLRGITVSDNPAEVLSLTKPDVALVTTLSRMDRIHPQLEQLVRAGVNVVSSCEELCFPWRQHADLAKKLDSLAKEQKVRVLGTGVNPGFVLDELVVTMAGVCLKVDRVEARRVLDAGSRRGPLQKKVGAGITELEFRSMAARKALGHVGLAESVAYIAEGLGWKLDSVSETIDPVISEKDVQTAFVDVKKGQVAGLRMTGTGVVNGTNAIILELQMYVGAEEPVDEISIFGEPDVRTIVAGGIHGDLATVAKLINSIPQVLSGDYGLLRPVSLGLG